jgi:hypothetical protein
VVHDITGRYLYKRCARDQHIIFGWLQVGDIWKPQIEPKDIPSWAEYHPHCEKELNPPEPSSLSDLKQQGMKTKEAIKSIYNNKI